MGEKLIVQRRGSTHSDGGKAAFKLGLAMTSAASFIEPNISTMPTSPVSKEEELKIEGDAVPSLHPASGSLGITSRPKESHRELKRLDASPFAQEHLQTFQSLEKCLALRDKYMQVSLQRLGDNPRDHDGHFNGLDPKIADVSGARPDADISAYASPGSEDKLPKSPYKPWHIYPKPPPPHWHWTPDTEPVRGSDGAGAGKEEFIFKKCEIPGSHDGWSFELDETGLYQVYNTNGSLEILCSFQRLR